MTKPLYQGENTGWKLENTYAKLPETLYTRMNPQPVSSPKLVVLNKPLAEVLGIKPEALESEEGIAVLAGNRIPEGAEAIAQAYAGHQFGHFTMLGDGRAVLLGEQLTPEGKRMDIQLKGSGQTPYSRQGDGRAALGPMLREYIISEAMHSLGIPTSRSLAVVTTGEPVFREKRLTGAILTRVASSHLRVGTFQYAAKWDDLESLKKLADYAWDRHFHDEDPGGNRYLSLLREAVKKQAELIAKWQLSGFVHGVMNTDNMAISGETIDYGPCAFMDTYHPSTVFSAIDYYGRYAYGNQPSIAGWNLSRFAETLLPLIHQEEKKAIGKAQEVLAEYSSLFRSYWLDGFRKKLGIMEEAAADVKLIEDLLHVMEKKEMDFTNTFRELTLRSMETAKNFQEKQEREETKNPEFEKWLQGWKKRIADQKKPAEEIAGLMKKSNPSIIPRNHRVEETLRAAVKQQDYRVMEELLKALADPYAYTSDQEKYAQLPPKMDTPYQTFCGT
ncbi:MAG: YdiU family protein [Tindallia sp. MSAO_Bac2]|nr:MAG: YdiU family protein [Tindallia sp. MSAO_Bac2]